MERNKANREKPHRESEARCHCFECSSCTPIPIRRASRPALHAQVVATLLKNGHNVDDCDLYAEAFDPLLSRRERSGLATPAPTESASPLTRTACYGRKRLSSFIPVWNEGFPAIAQRIF